MLRAHAVAFTMIVFVAACGADSSNGTGEVCSTSGRDRCIGNEYQICDGAEYLVSETCGGTLECAPGIGCVECVPNSGLSCVGDGVYECSAEGSLGAMIEDCGERGCSGGGCSDDCAATGSDLVYVVDTSYILYSFDPRKLPGNAFEQLGALDCPAGPALDGGDATPFSMSVDRSGRAWVLYTSGEIFWVSTADLSCTKSPWQPGTGGFELFGMGFVADGPGSSTETLYISGGNAEFLFPLGDLGAIDPETLQLSTRGSLETSSFNADNQPEMTGTGEGELFGFYPGGNAHVVHLDKLNGGELQAWPVSNQSGGLSAWAFAHWGGKYYQFISTTDIGGDTSNVYELDTGSGNNSLVAGSTQRIIVGAGVSTCAPTQID